MKNFFSILFLSSLLFACESNPNTAEKNTKPVILITNPGANELTEKPVVLSRKFIALKFDLAFDSGLCVTQNGKEVCFQTDDIDQDGEWDELLLLLDIKPGSTDTVVISNTDSPQTWPKATQTRLAYSPNFSDTFNLVTNHSRPYHYVAENDKWLYQYEGIGWENDKVAFRHYFDSRNGKDIFGKKTDQLVLDSIGLPRHTEAGDYHKELWWGMDVLKVGNSLGAGAIAMQIGDSLYRLGQTDSAKYIHIADGPLRSTFEIRYKGWKIRNKEYSVTERISIWKGKYWYENKVSVTPKPDGALATGIVTLKTPNQPTLIENNGYKALISHDQQSENKDFLGMAIIVNEDDYILSSTADSLNGDITATSVLTLKNNSSYYFFAGWEKSDQLFSDHAYFKKRVLEQATNITQETLIE